MPQPSRHDRFQTHRPPGHGPRLDRRPGRTRTQPTGQHQPRHQRKRHQHWPRQAHLRARSIHLGLPRTRHPGQGHCQQWHSRTRPDGRPRTLRHPHQLPHRGHLLRHSPRRHLGQLLLARRHRHPHPPGRRRSRRTTAHRLPQPDPGPNQPPRPGGPPVQGLPQGPLPHRPQQHPGRRQRLRLRLQARPDRTGPSRLLRRHPHRRLPLGRHPWPARPLRARGPPAQALRRRPLRQGQARPSRQQLQHCRARPGGRLGLLQIQDQPRARHPLLLHRAQGRHGRVLLPRQDGHTLPPGRRRPRRPAPSRLQEPATRQGQAQPPLQQRLHQGTLHHRPHRRHHRSRHGLRKRFLPPPARRLAVQLLCRHAHRDFCCGRHPRSGLRLSASSFSLSLFVNIKVASRNGLCTSLYTMTCPFEHSCRPGHMLSVL